jgi:hypothetical protein
LLHHEAFARSPCIAQGGERTILIIKEKLEEEKKRPKVTTHKKKREEKGIVYEKRMYGTTHRP